MAVIRKKQIFEHCFKFNCSISLKNLKSTNELSNINMLYRFSLQECFCSQPLKEHPAVHVTLTLIQCTKPRSVEFSHILHINRQPLHIQLFSALRDILLLSHNDRKSPVVGLHLLKALSGKCFSFSK